MTSNNKRITIMSGPHGTPVSELLSIIDQAARSPETPAQQGDAPRTLTDHSLVIGNDTMPGGPKNIYGLGEHEPFFVIERLNPVEMDEGEKLPPAVMDRFAPSRRIRALGAPQSKPKLAHLPRIEFGHDPLGRELLEMLTMKQRCFTTIAGSFKGVNERIESEIALLEKRDFNVSAYRDALMRVLEASQPFAGLMVQGGLIEVGPDICDAIENAMGMQMELDRKIRTANWYLDELSKANARFTADSATAPRTLKLADPNNDLVVLPGFIAFAADPSELKQSSMDALNSVKGHVERIEMAAADKALNNGRRFSSRLHMCNIMVKRGRLVEVSSQS